MAVTIRLLRLGKKHNPLYRVIVIDKRKKRNGRYIEVLGLYNPMVTPHLFKLDHERLNSWILKGATISEGLHKLLKKSNL